MCRCRALRYCVNTASCCCGRTQPDLGESMKRRIVKAATTASILAVLSAPSAVAAGGPTAPSAPRASAARATAKPAEAQTATPVPMVGSTSTRKASPAPAAPPASTRAAMAVSNTATASKPASSPMLAVGARGPAVVAMQTRLSSLGYWTGRPTGRYDHTTSQAVMAVQKVAGLQRDGVAGPTTQAALARGVRPKARSTRGRVLEVDLARQVLLVVTNGRVRHVFNTSTGASPTPTPKGTYRLNRRINRWHTAPLGELYRPIYFYRGYAVHGVRDGHIPGRPASHGCARVNTAAMDMLWGPAGVRLGDTVLVY